jgi:protein ImuB
MLWIALNAPALRDTCTPPHDASAPAPEQLALAWWALQFSPRVCVLEEAVLLEVQDSLRLFGGKRVLLQHLRRECAGHGAAALAVAPTALAALALLRHLAARAPDPLRQDSSLIPALSCTERSLQEALDALPPTTLSATLPHLPTLERLGCRTLGQLRALPRGGISRRFGSGLLDALDRAYGLKVETYDWIALPEQFSERLEFTGRIEVAEGLLFGARRLMGQLASWLQARQRGAVAITLHWEHDLVRRGDAHNGSIALRTAQATRDMQHLIRLLSENLARTALSAPVVAIRLEATETEPLATQSISLLPEDLRQGESLQQLVERLSARLGPERVLRGQLQADHRPQHMQVWRAAVDEQAARKVKIPLPPHLVLHPPWILQKPLRLAVQNERPLYQGPLRMLAGPERLEAGWWSLLSSAEIEGEELTLRDYYVAQSPHAGLLWIYRRRSVGEPGWFLHGIYG